jgi:hypothetical protein
MPAGIDSLEECMPPSNPRKRANAFEDFPVEPQAENPPVETQSPLVRRAAVVEEPRVERIERLTPSQMLPDRFQPRRLLPPYLRQPFFSGEIDCYKAASEWLELAKSDFGARAEVDKLLQMGTSFEDHGQILPITGSWVPTQQGGFTFLIETGERRFWAACLQAVLHKTKDEPLLRVEVVNHPTRQRQVLENRHAEAPSAVEQACEVASLILAELGIQPDPSNNDDYDYYRTSRAQRMPAGLWEKLMPVMQLTRPRMVQLLNILQLPSNLLDIADRYRIPERVIREILLLPREKWDAMIKHSAQAQLTSDDASISERGLTPDIHSGDQHAPQPIPDPALQAVRHMRRFVKVMLSLDEVSQSQVLDELADDFAGTAYSDDLLNILNEFGRNLDIRRSSK